MTESIQPTEPIDSVRQFQGYDLLGSREALDAGGSSMTESEARLLAAFIRDTPHLRRGKGRIHDIDVYRCHYMPGKPWRVSVTFVGPMYECGRTRRPIRPTYYAVGKGVL